MKESHPLRSLRHVIPTAMLYMSSTQSWVSIKNQIHHKYVEYISLRFADDIILFAESENGREKY